MFIGITTKFSLKDPQHIVRKSVAYLRKHKVKVDLCPNTCRLVPNQKPGLDFHKPYDMIVVFGGDGSVLRSIQYLRNFDSPLLSINMGRLGFFSDGYAKDYKKILDKVISHDYLIESRMLLRCTVMRKKRRAFTRRALNEVTIARDALARMIKLKTTADDLTLSSYVADGLVIASPTGSTGYSLSAGGPIVSPMLDSIILTPISPHSFTQKPIVLPPASRIKVHISTSEDRVFLTMDGQTGFHLKDNDLVKIKRSSKRIKMVRLSKSSYFHILREKLNWGLDLEGRRG